MLVGSSIVTTLLIPRGGVPAKAARRTAARSPISPTSTSGNLFGTIYDLSTVAILWFAGASAMVGLLNLVPRYLPRYGMAPEWAKANRPLVADLHRHHVRGHDPVQGRRDVAGRRLRDRRARADGIGGARRDARGLAGAGRQWLGYLLLTLDLRLHDRRQHRRAPEGIKIAVDVHRRHRHHVDGVARAAIDRAARARRSTPTSRRAAFIHEAAGAPVRIIANRPDTGDCRGVRAQAARGAASRITCRPTSACCSSRSGRATCRSSRDSLTVTGVDVGGHHVLRCVSPAIPNAIAALLLYCRDETGKIPHAYFGWTEGNPIVYLLKFLAFGEGDTAPVTREVLRQAEPNPMRRPRIHVG